MDRGRIAVTVAGPWSGWAVAGRMAVALSALLVVRTMKVLVGSVV